MAAQTAADIVIVEIGGTVGDMESVPYLEAARQLIREFDRHDIVSVHLTLVPAITGGELKSKPTQHSVKQLQEVGIRPDILLCRTERQLDGAMRKKIALFCNVSSDAVFTSPDIHESIYELPVVLHRSGIDSLILKRLELPSERCLIRPWTSFLNKFAAPRKKIRIGMVGKKDNLDDCYKSVCEALLHAAVTDYQVALELKKIDAETIESTNDVKPFFSDVDGIIVPGSSGQRGFLGLLAAVKYAREHAIPYMGIDLGMQLMAVETARSLCGWSDADSTEFMQTEHAIISLPEEQAWLTSPGLMKLGASTVQLVKGTKLANLYKKHEINERHRNKYIFDRRYTDDMAACGLVVCASSTIDGSVEAFEWIGHPWGIGVQYHPEFNSRPARPHPFFSAFIGAVLGEQKD